MSRALRRTSSRRMPALPPAGVLPAGPVAYMDIETTGLSPCDSSVTAVGILTRCSRGRQLEQFFVDDPDSEGQVLSDVVARLSHFSGVVSFNGNSFDLPFLRARARRHGLRLPWIEGWDLLYVARKWRREHGGPSNCRLQTLMRHFRLGREDWSSGADMVDAYWQWVNERDRQARQLILDHNAEDVMLLPELASRLVEPRRKLGGSARRV